jgi:lipoprotein-releasing system permease protein
VRATGFIAEKIRFKGRLAVVAIAVSFFVMIVSLAISAGFRTEIRRGISEIAGDIQLSGSEEPIDIHPSYYDKLLESVGVESITPVVWKPGIVKGSDDICGIMVKGVPMPDSCSLRARIPRDLAKRMKLEAGGPMTVWFIDEKAKARRFTVSEIYDGLIDSDGIMIVQVPLADMQRLCGWTAEQASALEVMVKPGWKDGMMLKGKAGELGWISYNEHTEYEDIFRAQTTRERYSQLFDWLDLIDFNVLTILLLMTVVAGFNMISGLLILLFRNISTIGMLKSLGMGNRAIARVFLRVAARIVLIGMVIGNAAALLFCLLEDTTHLIRLNPVNYFVSFVPVQVNWGLVLAVDLGAFAAIMLLLLIPTLFISKVDPAETVRVK